MQKIEEGLLLLNPLTGEITIFATGFSTIQGIEFDRLGRLYVLESMTQPGFPSPAQLGSGTIVRVDCWGHTETVVTGLSFPSAMTFGPDGKLYVSNFGFAVPPGSGQIVRVDLANDGW
jgi:sugar lactone lactonase YvrE